MTVAENKVLFLFTNEFPCSKTLEPYLEHELPYLASAFERVIIVPATINTIQKKIPSNVEVINIFDKRWFKSSLLNKFGVIPRFIHFYLSEKLDANSKSVLLLKNIVEDYKSFYNAVITGKALEIFSENMNIKLRDSSFYSYWFFHPVLTLSILKNKGKIKSFISRGHLGDIYLDQYPELSNFYNYKIKNVTKLLLISTHAKNYVDKIYPELKEKFVVSRLAVSDMGINPEPKDDFVLVSCSTYSERKRVDLLAELLSESPFQITWYHFGYVPPEVLEIYKSLIIQKSAKLKTHFMGDVPNHEVMEFYKSNPVNVIVNLSTSEGLPFSLIEANSFGIPVIATNVNGTPDIATVKNGFLLPINFESSLFYDCLVNIRNAGDRLRKGARELYYRDYNAKNNYAEVISYLKHQTS